MFEQPLYSHDYTIFFTGTFYRIFIYIKVSSSSWMNTFVTLKLFQACFTQSFGVVNEQRIDWDEYVGSPIST